jgi:REP element-mobilizing transposase RayT
MARAKRHYVPGQIWHLTQRCHKWEFLLKFKKDRHRWIQWLFEAKRRFGLVVLNYVVTSNHIHLIVKDDGESNIIPQSIGLIAGRTAQEYNRRKLRKGAFWEDRYHSTAIETGEHLLRCLVYIDLNMVRAGVVRHPAEWPYGGYNEIQAPRRKSVIIACEKLAQLAGFQDYGTPFQSPCKFLPDQLQLPDFCVIDLRIPKTSRFLLFGRNGFEKYRTCPGEFLIIVIQSERTTHLHIILHAAFLPPSSERLWPPTLTPATFQS